jgi:NAD(P)H-nitrite reductase large subunit
MEEYEITIIGDGREAVICAESAKKSYLTKKVAIVVSDYQDFIEKISSLFYFFIKKDKEGDFSIVIDNNNINVIVDEAIERRGHKLYLKSGRILLFEKLILAQGCKCPDLAIDGLDKKGIYFLKTNFDHIFEIKQTALDAERIVIYGGSYMGVKLADELLSKNKNVILIEKSAWLLPETIDSSLGKEVMVLLAAQGCKIILNKRIKHTLGNRKIEGVELSSSEKINCDILLVSSKSKPNVDCAQKLGLVCDCDKGILVDEYCRTSEKDIYAVGECAAHFEFFRGDLADAILSSTYVLEGSMVGSNLYSVIYNRNSSLENLYSFNSVS